MEHGGWGYLLGGLGFGPAAAVGRRGSGSSAGRRCRDVWRCCVGRGAAGTGGRVDVELFPDRGRFVETVVVGLRGLWPEWCGHLDVLLRIGLALIHGHNALSEDRASWLWMTDLPEVLADKGGGSGSGCLGGSGAGRPGPVGRSRVLAGLGPAGGELGDAAALPAGWWPRRAWVDELPLARCGRGVVAGCGSDAARDLARPVVTVEVGGLEASIFM